MNHQRALLAAVWLGLPLWLAGPADAHPAHVAIAEAEYNRETRRLEVALRVRPADLERALSLCAGRRVDLERTADAEPLAAAYVKRHFTLARGQQQQPLHWVGWELELKHAWLYFEVEAPTGIDGARLRNSVLMELLSDQANTVLLKDGARRTSLRLSKDKPKQTIRLR